MRSSTPTKSHAETRDEQQVFCMPIIQAGAEKIFLLGTTVTTARTDSIFGPCATGSNQVSHYFLLVLVMNFDEQQRHQLQDKVESQAQQTIPVTTVVLDLGQFNQWLQQGHPFACLVREKAMLLHDAGQATLAPAGHPDTERIGREQVQLWQQARIKVSEFLVGADLFFVRGQYKLSAFMLHQAAEQALHALLMIHTGLRVVTHSIDKLLRYCSLFCCELNDLFPKNQEMGRRLFQLLQKAYIDARYRDDYPVGQADIKALTLKVKTIQSLFEKYSALKMNG